MRYVSPVVHVFCELHGAVRRRSGENTRFWVSLLASRVALCSQDTVSGFLLTGIGHRDKSGANFLVVDFESTLDDAALSSASAPLILPRLPPY